MAPAPDEPVITETNPLGLQSQRARGLSPQLVFVLDCERPQIPPAVHLLDVDCVRFGRGSERAAARSESGGERVLTLSVPDRWASSAHAQLRPVLGTWALEDLGSKNGTLVGGDAVGKAELEDGDLIEIGRTFFRFRTSLPVGQLALPALPDPALTTLLPAFASELQRLRAIAASKVSVVLEGESGTGKELLAAAVHRLSGRSGAFQALNCGALPAHLVESELFGYRKGAFSGATEDRKGIVRSAEGGTLFLDEIGDLPLPAQAAMLRVLQEAQVQPLGSSQALPVDFRLIVATHRDLKGMVAQGTFRGDLLARISGFGLRLPPLRERIEDLGLLVGSLLRRHLGDAAAKVRFSPEAARALFNHRWPLNVRELEKCLQAAAVLAQGGLIEPSHLPPEVLDQDPLTAEEQERRGALVALFKQHRGNVTAVASAMGKARMQIQRWVKRFKIDLQEFRK